MSMSRMSSIAPSSASRAFEESVVRQATDNAWKSFGLLSDRFNSLCDSLDQSNRRFMDVSYGCSLVDPVLSDVSVEHTTLAELFQTCGNMELNKLLMTFSTLCLEMNSIRKDAQSFLTPLTLYGCTRSTTDQDNGQEMKEMSAFLPVLYDLLCLVNRSVEVVKNVTLQLEALFCHYRKQKTNNRNEAAVNVDVQGIRFEILFESLGKLCTTIIALDDVMSNQSILKKDLISYKRMMDLACRDGSSFGVQPEDSFKVKVLYTLCLCLERDVIDAYDDPKTGHQSFFSKILEAIVTASPTQEISTHSPLADQFSTFIRNSLATLEAEGKKDDIRWMSTISLFIIYVWLFKREDKKLLKVLLDAEKKSNHTIVHLWSNVTIIPDSFLFGKLPKSMLDKKLADVLTSMRDSLRTASLDKEVKSLKIRVYTWIVAIERAFDPHRDPSVSIVSSLAQQQQVLEEALQLATLLSSHVRSLIFLNVQAGTAISKKELIAVCRAIILLKVIEVTLNRKRASIFLFLSASSQYHSCIALKSLNGLKKRLVSEVKKYSEKKLDMISAVILASNCFHGPILTRSRQIVSSLCISMIVQIMTEIESSKIIPTFNQIEHISQILDRIRTQTNCSFAYSFRTTLTGVYFPHMLENDLSSMNELQYFFHALRDFESSVTEAYSHNEDMKKTVIGNLHDEVYSSFKTDFLDRFCTQFEIELRLQTHQELKLEDQNPFRRRMLDFSTPLSQAPFMLFDRFVSIKDFTQDYLSNMTYNLTTIALHDWKTYESMLNLAKTKYGLDFVKSQLPTQTVEQGLDVLEITRNIHVFVTKYNYNLNNQVFVEKNSENKHLNVLLIRHVSNSIQTHGYGIINTAVNLTYQFVKKKLNEFNKFLYEEHVKSRLIKDIRLFRESGLQRFPFERADKFVKGIRKLGLTKDGSSFLDQFRGVITEIGNALGFVRMLRSGALHCSSMCVNFAPDLDDLPELSFSVLAEAEHFEGEVHIATKNLDCVLSTLNRNFSEATDYFKLLVDVFSKNLRDPKNPHLRNFYVVLPALTLSFIEHSIACKEKMHRKNSAGAAFTDDGFTVGVAYLLKLLDQWSDFESLQWFPSVKEKVLLQRNEAIKEKNAVPTDDKLTQTTSLTLKRLDVLQKEFDHLHFNMTSCKILFRS